MKILVISDSHENYPAAVKALDNAAPVDMIIHLGDGCNDAMLLNQLSGKELLHVSGNCDLGSKAPRETVWECRGKRIMLTHGDRYGVKHGLDKLKRRAEELQVDAVFYGHTHQAALISLPGLILLNPGPLLRASDNKSYAVVEISDSGICARIHNML